MSDHIDAWLALSPISAWLLNQESVTDPVLDLVADADETGRSGTSVISISDLAFDVGGDAAPASFMPARRRGH